MGQGQQAWYPEVLSAGLLRTAESLSALGFLHGFYLAGGTALALQFGHRRSVDLDWFTPRDFSEDLLIGKLQKLPDFSVVSRSSQTLHLHLSGAKISLLGYPYPLLFPVRTFRGLTIADERDIACMKVSALAGRGARRDFIDLFFAAQRYGLQLILEWFGQKFAAAKYSMVHIRKSLTYFSEAESDPMPEMLVPVSWPSIRTYFEGAVRTLEVH